MEKDRASRKFQRCTCCVMDTTDSRIVFDENGVCFVQLKDGKKTVYLTVEYDSCFSWSTECYLQPTQRHS